MSDTETPRELAGEEGTGAAPEGPRSLTAASPRKVVIVDNNREAADALGVHLQAAGYDVMVTYTGKDAWQACKEFVPAAMIVDIGLPRLNGFQLARRIRRTAWGMRALLIAVTGWGTSGDTELAKFVGFDHYREKPIDFAEIEQLVQATAP
jgi:DNA-binding response OmpR family regulator